MNLKTVDYKLHFVRLITTTGFLVLLTALNYFLDKVVDYRALGMIYLMGITTASLYLRNYNIFLATVLGAICWNLLFIPPKFTFAIHAPEDWTLIVLYLVAGIVIGTLMKRLKANEAILKTEKNRATQLYKITKALSSAEDVTSLVTIIRGQIHEIFNCPSCIIFHESPGQEFHPSKMTRNGEFIPQFQDEDLLIQSVVRKLKPAGKFTDDFSHSRCLYYPLIGEKKLIGILVLNLSSYNYFTSENWLILDAMSRQLSTGLLRERFEVEMRGKMINEESERIYKTLLNSVSHEMRTPLSAIKGFSAALLDKDLVSDAEKIKSIAEEIALGVERLDYVVQNLLDMSRLESGNLKLKLDYADIVETINTAIRKVKKYHGGKRVFVTAESDLPLIYVDYFLIEQVFENVLRNAFLYTPPESPIEISVGKEEHYINVIITDFGTGIKILNPDDVFKKFFREKPQEAGGLGLGLSICKSILELHKGYISVENLPTKGASFTIKIPRELDRELYAT
jgi:two-component system, OmpR family, sensor histidine kinase KdpD